MNNYSKKTSLTDSDEIIEISSGAHIIYDPPKAVGYMEILPSVEYHITKKPKWFHRIMVRILLGWKWVDYKK